MKMSRLSGGELAAVTMFLLSPLPTAAMLDCRRMRVDDHTFDFGALHGPHSVVTSAYNAITNKYTNTTYTMDLCAPLKRKSDVPKSEECPNGSRVCAITHVIDPAKEGQDRDVIDWVVPISAAPVGQQLEYELTRLSTSDSTGDSDKEGVRLVLKGGKLNGQEQRAAVELICDQSMTGLEGEWDAEDVYIPGEDEAAAAASRLGRRDGSSDDEHTPPTEADGWSERQLKKDGAALIWEKYEEKPDHQLKVLHLTWYTKYACESLDNDEPPPDERSAHWGFFTWFVIIVFLLTAAYLIFGSWLNYTRYGARGWDLLPHGDTIRDLPYLLKDWTRRVLNTVQGSGSRGGYSAV